MKLNAGGTGQGAALSFHSQKTGGDKPVPLQFFDLSNLRKSAAVAFLSSEFRRYKRAHNLQRQLFTHNASSQAQHVAVVMFA
jgi:hypothetical protein